MSVKWNLLITDFFNKVPGSWNQGSLSILGSFSVIRPVLIPSHDRINPRYRQSFHPRLSEVTVCLPTLASLVPSQIENISRGRDSCVKSAAEMAS